MSLDAMANYTTICIAIIFVNQILQQKDVMHLGCENVAWPRKTAMRLKGLILEYGQDLCNYNTLWDEIMRLIRRLMN